MYLSRDDRDKWTLLLHEWYEEKLGLDPNNVRVSNHLMDVLDDQFEQFHEQIVAEMEDIETD